MPESIAAEIEELASRALACSRAGVSMTITPDQYQLLRDHAFRDGGSVFDDALRRAGASEESFTLRVTVKARLGGILGGIVPVDPDEPDALVCAGQRPVSV